MGQLQNQFQQMAGGQSPYSSGGQQNRRVPWWSQGPQQNPRGGGGGRPGVRPNTPWQEFEPQKPQQASMQRGIDQMPGRVPPTTGQGMQQPQPPQAAPPGTGGFKPQAEPVTPAFLGPPAQAPADGVPIAPVSAQGQVGAANGGMASQPLGQKQLSDGYRNPYRRPGPRPDGGPQYA